MQMQLTFLMQIVPVRTNLAGRAWGLRLLAANIKPDKGSKKKNLRLSKSN